jgi:hypothetical protein
VQPEDRALVAIERQTKTSAGGGRAGGPVAPRRGGPVAPSRQGRSVAPRRQQPPSWATAVAPRRGR